MAGTEGVIRLGMVGCGAMAAVHGEALQASDRRIVIAACADRALPVAQAFAARFGIPAVYDDMVAMVRAERLDGIVLATWPAQHHRHVEALIEAGARYILCEKSLSVSGALALEMMEKASASGAVLVEAFMLRLHPLYCRFVEMVREGVTGPIDTVRASFQEFDSEDAEPGAPGPWRRRPEDGGGVAYDGTCYPVHVCAHLANSLPARVAFDGTIGRYGALTRLHGFIRYENGVTGLIHSSLRAVVSREAEVSGTRASLLMPVAFGFNTPEGASIRRRTGTSNLSMREEVVASLEGASHEIRLAPRLQLEHFAAVVRGEARPHTPLTASVVNAFTLDAMMRSAMEGRIVDVVLPASLRDAWANEAVGG